MKLLNQLSNFIYKIETVLAILFASSMLISLSLGVIYRYVLNSPLIWAEEIAIFSLVWLTFIGGSMGIKRQETASVSILIDKLTGRLRQVLFGIGVLFLIVFLIYIIVLSVQWLSSPNIKVQHSNALGMPMLYAYLSVPVGFLFMTIHSIELFFKSFQQQEGDVC